MKLFLKFDSNTACKKIIQELLSKLNIQHTYLGFAEIEIPDTISSETFRQLDTYLGNYGIEVIENQKSILVQKIKDVVKEMVYLDQKPSVSNSAYLSDKLKQRYGFISAVFSEVTFTSIENYIILQKSERAKQLIIMNELNFTEIAYLLNYSSVAHFSSQFKSVTGITPTAFQRIINKRRNRVPVMPQPN